MGAPSYPWPVRNFSWQVRADKLPANVTTASAVVTPGGPTYSATVGAPLVLPSGVELPSDKFVSTSGHYIGTTAQRPSLATDPDITSSLVGTIYFDTTLSKAILHDGLVWRDVFTGNAV